MSVWFRLRINAETLGAVEIRRCEPLDLNDPAAIADEVCTYTVDLDGYHIGAISHRYGDGAWRLLALAADLIAKDQAVSVRTAAGPAGSTTERENGS